MTIPPRVLLVDDEPSIRELGSTLLSKYGYEVDTAEDGVLAWDALQKDHYDVVITDNLMPNLTGLGLIRKIKDAKVEVPVIMITGTIPSAEFRRFPALIPFAVLHKPFRLGELLDAIAIAKDSARAA